MGRALLPAVLCGLALAGSAVPAPSALTGRFLLVYVADGEERLAQSRDGVRWAAVSDFAARGGERPSAVRRGRQLYVVDQVEVTAEGISGELLRFRATGSRLSELTPSSFVVELASPGDALRATAITASIALDADGRLTLLYALRLEPETNACPVPGQSCVKVRTATEAAGSDGARFAGDAGSRAVVSFAPGDDVRDPAAFATAKGYLVVLFGPGACLRLLTAADLHGSYRPARRLAGGCIADELPVATPSGAYRPFLKEHWLYAVSDGRLLRASTRTLTRQLPARRFRPLRLPGGGVVTSAHFALNAR